MAQYYLDDTIAAIATPVGEGGISVIRLSGTDSLKIGERVFRSKKEGSLVSFPSHTIHWGEICNEQGEIFDQVLISLFRSPHSYTGEDVIEISSHGGIAVTRRILELLIHQGARHAEPGEFTKRAFLNGRMDLMQAEAVLDLIKAKSQRSLDVAVRQLAGGLSGKLRALKDRLMKVYAHLEAYVDFPEEDLEIFSDSSILDRLRESKEEISDLISSFHRAGLLREGIVAVIVGKPNVGKSSLFNTLLERDRALVSRFPGTTRDHLEESIEIDGIYIRLCDTAGLGLKSKHPLDQIGMRRTKETLQEAQLFLYLVDGSRPLGKEDRKIFKSLHRRKPVLILVNKADLRLKMNFKKLEAMIGKRKYFLISTKTRQGISQVEGEISNLILGNAIQKESEQITKLRHKTALEKALVSVKRAELIFSRRESLEFVTLDIRAALHALQELVGEVYSEDLLDAVFSEFCIGK